VERVLNTKRGELSKPVLPITVEPSPPVSDSTPPTNTRSEQLRDDRRQRRLERYNEVIALHRKGMSQPLPPLPWNLAKDPFGAQVADFRGLGAHQSSGYERPVRPYPIASRSSQPTSPGGGKDQFRPPSTLPSADCGRLPMPMEELCANRSGHGGVISRKAGFQDGIGSTHWFRMSSTRAFPFSLRRDD
jgi:hypothetical protein